MSYRHVQKGFFAVPTILLAAVVGFAGLASSEDTTKSIIPTILFIVILLPVVLVFSRLEVTVAEGQVQAAFGRGWPQRTIDLADVVDSRSVRNKWFYGWGIRRLRHGWMYNVWGLDAVELEFSSGKTFRIGTNDPEQLLQVVQQSSSG